jgi:Down syndrome cell adhesion protein
MFLTFFTFFRLSFIGTNSLRIDNVGREDRGMYQCIVSDGRESVQASSELKLGGELP